MENLEENSRSNARLKHSLEESKTLSVFILFYHSKYRKDFCCMFLFNFVSLTMHKPQYVVVNSDCGTNR